MFRCQDGERNVITYEFLWRGHVFSTRMTGRKYICIHSDVEPMQEECKLFQRALITVVSVAYVDFVTIVKDAFQLVTKS